VPLSPDVLTATPFRLASPATETARLTEYRRGQSNGGDPRTVAHILVEKPPVVPDCGIVGVDRSAVSHQTSGRVHNGEECAGTAKSSFGLNGSGPAGISSSDISPPCISNIDGCGKRGPPMGSICCQGKTQAERTPSSALNGRAQPALSRNQG
jgi:hypothetical protein